jgi:hypothetical protein
LSATREHRNASMIEDAAASVGMTIAVTEHLLCALASVLPDDFDVPAVNLALGEVRDAHDKLQGVLGS